LAENVVDNPVTFSLNLRLGESVSRVTVAVPARPMWGAELLPIIQQFDDAVVALGETESRREGVQVSCRPGCAACCRQLIPVGQLEAPRLAQLVAELPPERRLIIDERFAAARERVIAAGLLTRLEQADQHTDSADRVALGVDYFALRIDCPFLEDERCSIYADRPVACREYVVTSPPEQCWSPTLDAIEAVPISVHVSATLYRFNGSESSQPAKWRPLILALDPSADDANSDKASESDPPPVPGPELFRRFLRQLSE
jgi:Fe-S-cluster containining protein